MQKSMKRIYHLYSLKPNNALKIRFVFIHLPDIFKQKAMSKYVTNQEENQLLPNLQGLTDPEQIAEAEFEGFLMAEILFTERLTATTRFNCKYICDIHKTALKELYSFAGKYRTVNMSKGGFLFPAALFIPQNMQLFEEEFLSRMPDIYTDKDELIHDTAVVHGELLFIHPFREGNGRTARLLANLMIRKQGYDGLRFERINFKEYIIAVQHAGEKNYTPMERIIRSIF